MEKDTKLLIGIGGTGAKLTDQIKKALEKREPMKVIIVDEEKKKKSDA